MLYEKKVALLGVNSAVQYYETEGFSTVQGLECIP